MNEQRTAPTFSAVTTAAIKEARRSVAALLLKLPEEVWRGHKGTVENAISQTVEELYALAAERDRLRAGIEAWVADCGLCGATGVVDSGGVTPWGAGIEIPCPDCSPLRDLLREPRVPTGTLAEGDLGMLS